jgi:hypothetical protein
MSELVGKLNRKGRKEFAKKRKDTLPSAMLCGTLRQTLRSLRLMIFFKDQTLD